METTTLRVMVSADLADLVPRYLNNRHTDLAFARQLLNDREFVQLAGMAHRIRGSALSYGFSGLGEIATAIEAAAEVKDSRAIETQLQALERFLTAVEVGYI